MVKIAYHELPLKFYVFAWSGLQKVACCPLLSHSLPEEIPGFCGNVPGLGIFDSCSRSSCSSYFTIVFGAICVWLVRNQTCYCFITTEALTYEI